MSAIAAIILAAGGSTRMRRPKQLCEFHGVSFLRHTAALALAVECAPIITVLQSCQSPIAAELRDLPLSIVENPDWQNGIGTSLRCGIRALLPSSIPLSHLLIMLCDQPLVTEDHLRALMSAAITTRKQICVSYDGSVETPPVVIAAELFPRLLQMADDRGAKSIWANHPEWVHHVHNKRAAVDIDTPQDYETLRGFI
jgi:molybdenum cofactor cytidylyltransferase